MLAYMYNSSETTEIKMSKQQKQPKEKKLLYVSLVISSLDTQGLTDTIKMKLKLQGIDTKYTVQRNEKDPAHITLCYHSDFKTREEFEEFVTKNYKEKEICEIKSKSMVFDKHCVALTAEVSVPYYPSDKNLHITMMLNDKKPVYSNVMLKQLYASKSEDSKEDSEGHEEGPKEIKFYPYSIAFNGTLCFVYSS